MELIFKALDVEPIILSAGELESEWAGEPGQLIRSRYRDAHLVINNRVGKEGGCTASMSQEQQKNGVFLVS